MVLDTIREHLRSKGIAQVSVLKPSEESEAIARIEIAWRNGMVMRGIGVYPFPEKEDAFHLWYPTEDVQDYRPHFTLSKPLEEMLIMLALIVSKQDSFDEKGVPNDRPRLHNRSDLVAVYRELRQG